MNALYDHGLELRVLATLADVSSFDITEAKNTAERSRLTTDDFHSPFYKAVFGAQMGLLFEGEACEFGRLGARLNDTDRKRLPDLILGQSMGTSHSIMGCADDLRGMTLRRNILRFGQDLAASAADAISPELLLSSAMSTLNKITNSRAATWRTLSEVMVEVDRELASVASGAIPVIPTGVPEWDRIIGGFWPTLMVLGAHPGQGKSGLIGRFVLNLALAGKKVAVFSLEDQATWLAYRALSSESGITQFILRTRKLTEDQRSDLQHGRGNVMKYGNNIFIDERGALAPAELVQTARDAVLNKSVDVVIVDHLGELRYGESDRHDLKIQEGLSDLRNLAKGYGVPIFCASHLKREAIAPFKQSDFANAAAIERQSRVLVGFEKKEDKLTLSVLKNTFGVAGVAFQLPFHGPSALVTNDREAAKPTQESML